MRRLSPAIFLVLLPFVLNGQQTQYKKGWPRDPGGIDIRKEFRNPPKGYGNVPFFWWNGDSLRMDRLREELEILSSSATDGFAVSYIHTAPAVDSLENKDGHGLFGRTEPGRPEVFSDKWWEIWNAFSTECAGRGMGAGLDDYTVGWKGNGYYPDELDTMSVFKGSRGSLKFEKETVKAGGIYRTEVSDSTIEVVAWPGKVRLLPKARRGRIEWKVPRKGDVTVYKISTVPGYELHPEHGRKLVEVYFDRFEDRMDEEGRCGMNYFFQDELSYPLTVGTWSDDFAAEFSRRKGYDILPYLPALRDDIGEETPRIRIDYCEVLSDLAEERYFKPVYDWHASRGLIYGCDNLGRGLDPSSYIDYFRETSWFTAPGNDAPARGSSFIQTKVSSSIAHLYGRPRTWLEAFHSMGWGSSGEWLTRQIDHHFIAGGNLVCMHGLYYSTHGGWWEWAPPDFHFRMPYWSHMKKWLEYTERMSYILSQGDHVADIAVLYPTETRQAFPDADMGETFNVARRLSESGLDYDFVDFRSLRDAKVVDGTLRIGRESYKVVVKAGIRITHRSTEEKLGEFRRSGGIVIEDAHPETLVPKLITPDFMPQDHSGKVLHRRIGDHDVYFVTDVSRGVECFFRAKGRAELWDASSGTMAACPVLRQDGSGTWIRMDREKGVSYLVVFSPGEPEYAGDTGPSSSAATEIPVEGEWRVSLVPTMDNKWGDFRLPASPGLIGAEARTFRCLPSQDAPEGWTNKGFDDSSWSEYVYGYGPQALTGTEGSVRDEVAFSWQYGVWDQPGGQGYHGLKGKVDDRFFILDKGPGQRFKTWVKVPSSGEYVIVTAGCSPDGVSIDGRPASGSIFLGEGWHVMEAVYSCSEKAGNDHPRHEVFDGRKRSFIALYPAGGQVPPERDRYSGIVASRWHGSPHLLYDPYGGTRRTWCCRFGSVPGMDSLRMSIHGKVLRSWLDGEEADPSFMAQSRFDRPGGAAHSSAGNGMSSGLEGGLDGVQPSLNEVSMHFGGTRKRVVDICLLVEADEGFNGGAIFASPVGFSVSEGLLQAGDWSSAGSLLHYSGGIRYRKEVTVPEGAGRVLLDLGRIVATCEVKVGGKDAGVMIAPPYRVDVTDLVHPGPNEVEVLVYSTLANYYQTVPTPYRGDPEAGLVGPVKLIVESK